MATRSGEVGHGPDHNQSRHPGGVVHPVQRPGAEPQKPKPAAFDAADFPLCEEGEDQAVVFGQCWSKSWMVLTVDNRRLKAIKTKASKK
nr:hypothetical protein [Pseudomonas aeruginosa]